MIERLLQPHRPRPLQQPIDPMSRNALNTLGNLRHRKRALAPVLERRKNQVYMFRHDHGDMYPSHLSVRKQAAVERNVAGVPRERPAPKGIERHKHRPTVFLQVWQRSPIVILALHGSLRASRPLPHKLRFPDRHFPPAHSEISPDSLRVPCPWTAWAGPCRSWACPRASIRRASRWRPWSSKTRW